MLVASIWESRWGAVLFDIQSREKVLVRGCEKFLPALAWLFCLALPGSCLARFAKTFSQLCTARYLTERTIMPWCYYLFIITIWVWLKFRLFRSVRRQHRHKPRLGFAGSNLHITREQRGAFFEANRCVMALSLSLSLSLLRLEAAGQKTWLISPFLCLIGQRRHFQAVNSLWLPITVH